MKEKLVKISPVLFIVLLALAFAKLHANKRSGGKDECFTICGDARGYYAWLPAMFIYHDLNFHFFDSVEMKDTTCGGIKEIPIQDYRYSFDGRDCDKYYPGSAFLTLPFFAIAHYYTGHFTSYPANGYSTPYFRVMAYSGTFWYFIGMLFFLGILNRLRLTTGQKILTLLFTTCGSAAIYYVIDAPLYSHIYSFTLIAAFVYFALRLREKISVANLAALSFTLGFIFITRPVNVSVALLIPFIFWGNIKRALADFSSRPANYLAILSVAIMPAILFSLYKASTGRFFIYSYAKEGFDFLHPHFLSFLIQYDNGILPYTPIMLLPLVFLLKRNPAHGNIVLGIAITLLITIYIHSSWWCWDYGFSFGARTMLDFMPLSGILIGLSLQRTGARGYTYLLPVYFICCALTMILYHQKSANHFMNDYPIKDYWEALKNVGRLKS